ncbi:Na+/H+ antiporter [Klebsormidium nitens]|uniref:Na+/H+ antiporter n=1 Tax=Klebsormidium nitens TaxID=105231 RepID=A0A1Y1I6M2_KLENI|nr:Na+/H+ antiporter [Klebsormidium nitens]|eukprot:GAQ84367.1 Na+/H+ antiporter [Klebsormidium nitens]
MALSKAGPLLWSPANVSCRCLKGESSGGQILQTQGFRLLHRPWFHKTSINPQLPKRGSFLTTSALHTGENLVFSPPQRQWTRQTSLDGKDGYARGRAVQTRAAADDKVGLDDDEDEEYYNSGTLGGSCDPLCSVDETSSEDYQLGAKNAKSDIVKAVAIGAAVCVGAGAIQHSWVAEHQDLAMALVFIAGYAGIIFEEFFSFNKSGVGLVMAVSLWTIRSLASSDNAGIELRAQGEQVSEIVFFLLGAMTIVEIVDAHQGFKLVTDSINTSDSKVLLWVLATITFFLSSILDNLTTTIVMVSLLRKLVPDPEQRRFYGAVVVIAANAGGAWTPIGDVTTTMLWINGQITTFATMKDLFLPSFVSLALPLVLMTFSSDALQEKESRKSFIMSEEAMAPRGKLVFFVGLGALLFVPIFKSLTGLPPYLGMLLGLGVLWVLTDAIHLGEDDRQKLKVPQALSRIDTQGVLFFLGILLSISSLDAAGLLKELATFLDEHLPNVDVVATVIGLASSVIDNVPLVAATQGMYSMQQYPVDDRLWQLIAYCAGTGGSILVIGSAAGVAYMGMEKVDFFWYLKKISPFALAGYMAGIGVYLLQNQQGVDLPSIPAMLPLIPGLG